MPSPPTFPALPGQGWSVTKTPRHSTKIAAHESGREVRVRSWPFPLYSFELTFNALASNGAYSGVGANTLQMLLDFYDEAGGSAGTFLYSDPSDSYATGQVLGTGDGATSSFQFYRSLFRFSEPVGWVSYVRAAYQGGAGQIGNWTLAEPTAATPYPTLVFEDPPPAGVVVTADFNWSFVCRFSDDTVDFEEIMSNLWQVKSLKFQSVRNSGF